MDGILQAGDGLSSAGGGAVAGLGIRLQTSADASGRLLAGCWFCCRRLDLRALGQALEPSGDGLSLVFSLGFASQARQGLDWRRQFPSRPPLAESFGAWRIALDISQGRPAVSSFTAAWS